MPKLSIRDLDLAHKRVLIRVDFNVRPNIDQEALHGPDIAHARNAAQHHRFIGQQRCGESGQGGVLGAAGGDCSVQRHAAFYDEFIHLFCIFPAFNRGPHIISRSCEHASGLFI